MLHNTTNLIFVLCALVAATLSGCAIVHPRIDQPAFALNDTYATTVTKANDAIKSMEKKQKVHEKYDFGTGLVLFTAGLSGTGFGLFGANRNFIIGSALVGGASLGARAAIPVSARVAIYEQGKAAIACSMAVTSLDSQSANGGGGGAGAGGAGLAGASAMLNSAGAKLASAQLVLFQQSNTPSAVLAGVRAAELSAAIQTVNEKVSKVSTTLASDQLQQATRLQAALRAIIVATNTQLGTAVFNPAGALAAAQQGIGSFGQASQDAAKQALDAVDVQQSKAAAAAAAADETKKTIQNPPQIPTSVQQPTPQTQTPAPPQSQQTPPPVQAPNQAATPPSPPQTPVQGTTPQAPAPSTSVAPQLSPAVTQTQVQRAADDLKGAADDATNIANQLRPVLIEMLSKANVSQSCLNPFLSQR